jgi:hypothetical protein
MALRKVPIPLPFAGGVDTETDPKQVPPAKLIDLQNAVFDRSTTLIKRNGYSALSRTVEGAGLEYEEAHALAVRDDELVVFADGRGYSHRPIADRWSDTGEVAAVIGSDVPLARTGTTQTMPDIATLSGVSLLAWEDSRGGVWWSLVETATGRILREPAQADASGIQPRCVAVGSILQLLWVRSASGQLWIMPVNPAEPTAATTSSVLVSDLNTANQSYDAQRTDAANNPGVIAWAILGGFRVAYLDPSGVIGGPGIGYPSAITYAAATNGPVAVSYGTISGVDVVAAAGFGSGSLALEWTVLNASTFATIGDDVITTDADLVRMSMAVHPTDNSLRLVYEVAGATANLSRVYTSTVPDVVTGLDLESIAVHGHGLVSRCWVDGVHVYAVLGHEVEFFPYAAAVQVDGDATDAGNPTLAPVVARLLPGEFAGLPTRGHIYSAELDEDDDRIWRVPLTARIQLSSENLDQFGEVGIRRATLDFDHPSAFQSAQLGRGLYLAGASPLHYDGYRWAEMGFHTAPDVASSTSISATPASGGSMTSSQEYSYLLWYEEIDAQGELHQGGTSVPVVVTMGGSDTQVTLLVPTCRLTARARVRIGVARCPAADPTAFYRVTSLDPALDTGANRYVLNDSTADTVTFLDRLSDAELITREPLYTNGGILSNDPSPCAGEVITGGKNRLFWTDPSDPNVVRYSQELLDGNAVECPADLSLRVDPYGGPITGLAVLDDALVILKESAIYIVGGPGPLSNPSTDPNQFGFTPAQLVTGDAGCSSQDSIGYTPIGLLFQSSKGVMLLGRDRQLQRVGDPVVAYDAQRVVRSTLLPDRTQIICLTDESDGRTLLYDYKRQQWSTFTNHVGVDAVVVGGVYHYLRADGRVFVETPGLYRDDNSQIPMVIDTAWIKLAGYLQGWQRIYHASFIGEYKSPHTLRVSYRLDYEPGWSAPFDLDVNTNFDPSVYGDGLYGSGYYGGGVATSSVYQRRIHIGKRCQSVRFRIEDVQATADYGDSFELSELLLTGGVLASAFKLPAARSN